LEEIMTQAASAITNQPTLERVITADDLAPNDDRVLCRRITYQRVGRIELAQAEKSMFAKVLSVGPGKLLENGQRAAMRTKPGQTILLPYGAQETKLSGDDIVIILRDVDIVAHVELKERKPVTMPGLASAVENVKDPE
jgi:chaperonin GroES